MTALPNFLKDIVSRAKLTADLYGVAAGTNEGIIGLAEAHAERRFLAEGSQAGANRQSRRLFIVREGARFAGIVRSDIGGTLGDELSQADLRAAEKLGAATVRARLKELFAAAQLWGPFK